MGRIFFLLDGDVGVEDIKGKGIIERVLANEKNKGVDLSSGEIRFVSIEEDAELEEVLFKASAGDCFVVCMRGDKQKYERKMRNVSYFLEKLDIGLCLYLAVIKVDGLYLGYCTDRGEYLGLIGFEDEG